MMAPEVIETTWTEVSCMLLGPTVLMVLAFALSGLGFDRFSRVAFVPGMGVEYVFLLVLLAILRSRGDGLRCLRWGSSRGIAEPLVGAGFGLLLFILFGVLSAALAGVLPSTSADIRAPRPPWAGWVYGIGLLTAFAPIEEIIWRGYAIPRLQALTHNTTLAVVLSSLAFASLHWWGGPLLMVLTGLAGLAYAALFLWRDSLRVSVAAHFVADLPLFLFMVLNIRPPG